MFTRASILALAAAAMFASPGLTPTTALGGRMWDRFHDRVDIRHDYVDIRHDLLTGQFADAFHDLQDVRRDRRSLFWTGAASRAF